MRGQKNGEDYRVEENGLKGYNNPKACEGRVKAMTGVKQVKVTSVVKNRKIVAQTKTAILSGGTRRRRIQRPS